ncbi:hypothetical protein VTK56DRAFT_7556 [Thermocarpiscus australiensis]
MRGLSHGRGGAVDMILKVVPVASAFFAFLFLAIALSSGVTPNYLEGLSIINFNTSTLGQNLIKAPDIQGQAQAGCNKAGNAVDNAADKVGDGIGKVAGVFGGGDAENKVNNAVDGAGDKAGGATEDACNKGAEVADDAVQGLADAVNKALGSVAKAIGIKEYYSLHIGALCDGVYDPKFSDKNAKPNVQECTKKFDIGQTNLSKTLDEQLQVGPFHFKLSDLKLADSLQDALDTIPRALAAMAFFFLFATLCALAGFLLALATVAFEYVLQRLQRAALLGALGFAALAWLAQLVGAVGITAAAEKIKDVVNRDGAKFGISAATSPGLYFLLWAAFALTTVTLALLLFVWWRTRRSSSSSSYRSSSSGGGMVYEGKEGAAGMDEHGFAPQLVSGGPLPGQRY